MCYEKTMWFRVFAVVCVLFTTITTRKAFSQSPSLTRTGGGVTGFIESQIFVPECNYEPEQGTGTPDQRDLEIKDEDGAVTDLAVAVQQALSNDCGDAVTTNLGVGAHDTVPGNVNCNTLFQADADGDAIAGEDPDILLGSTSTKIFDAQEPAGGLTGSDVLVFHGSVRVHQGGAATIVAASATLFLGEATPIDLTVNTDDPVQLNGTVRDVLNGTTTNYSVDVSSGVYKSFSVVVDPGEFIIKVSAASQDGWIMNRQVNAESDAMIDGELSVFDSSAFPTMTIVNVTQ